MEIDALAHTSGEWLRGTGPQSDIVISSRVRLARNIEDFPFLSRASDEERAEIERILRKRIVALHLSEDFGYIDVARLEGLDRQFLVERQLISREHAEGNGSRGVAVGRGESVSLMVNEEDHLRLQVMRSGMALEEAWDEIHRVDDALEEHVSFSFSPQLGYLTACPTNVGTGMRVSVMLHLPALVISKRIERVFRAIQKLNLAVRGLYGEGSQAMGDFYQISNQITLGKSEEKIIADVQEVVPKIIEWERQARSDLLRESQQALHDRVSRAFGILKTAQTISSEETMHLLSSVRMGVNLDLIQGLDIPTVNQLFIQTQPAHLQKLRGAPLESSERNVARATYLRSRLKDFGNGE